MRERLGEGYVDALRRTYGDLGESIDFVMFWWARAAELLTRKKTPLRRFGLVTTNSITQSFNRRVIEAHTGSTNPISLIYVVPDHPWTKADSSSAQVRIAMSVGEAGSRTGEHLRVVSESGLDTDDPQLIFLRTMGRIAPDFSAGANVVGAGQLLANADLAHQGVTPLGEGFRLEQAELELLGYDPDHLPPVIKRYAIGRDLVQRAETRFIIDFYGLTERECREYHPALFQMVLERVRPERLLKNRQSYRDRYWIYAEPRARMRKALCGLDRYMVTCRTAKHRLFSFVSGAYLPDAKIVAIATDAPEYLALLSSHVHGRWARRTGAWLGVGNDSNYNHSDCLGKFPFPDLDELTRDRLRALGEELDATRKQVQAEHPDLTLTGLYNVLEKLRAGEPLTDKDEDVKSRGRVLILKDLHDQIDRATMQAYGWDDLIPSPPGGEGGRRSRSDEGALAVASSSDGSLSGQQPPQPSRSASHLLPQGEKDIDEIILERLVALNAERAAEEAAGHVRWLRPDYQVPRFARGAAAPKSGDLDLGDTVVALGSKKDGGLPAFPKDKGEQVMAIRRVLTTAARPMDAATIARAFKGGGKRIEQRVHQALQTLVRYAEVTALPNGSYAARRAA